MVHQAAKKMSHGQSAIESSPGSTAGRLLGQSAIESATPTARGLRGQSAMETLVLAGFALVFMVPLVLLFLSASNNDLSKTSLQQAKITARTIADEAGELYLQGPGAKKAVTVNYPSGVVNGSVEEGLVVLTLDVQGRRQDVVSTTFANVSGNLSGARSAGLQKIGMEYNSTGNFVYVHYG